MVKFNFLHESKLLNMVLKKLVGSVWKVCHAWGVGESQRFVTTNKMKKKIVIQNMCHRGSRNAKTSVTYYLNAALSEN